MKNYELARNISLLVASSSLLAGCAVRESDALFNESSEATNLIIENSFETSTTIADPIVIDTLGAVSTESSVVVDSTDTTLTTLVESSVVTSTASESSIESIDVPAKVEVVAERVEQTEVLDCSDNLIVVFGNSTDSVTGVNIDDMSKAWPARLQALIQNNPQFSGVSVFNNAKPGVTMDYPNPWSDAHGQRWTADIPFVFADYSPEMRANAVVILSPSIIDLQLNDGDVDATLLGFQKAYDMLKNEGIKTIVTLPMNSVVEDSLMSFTYPWLVDKMDEFNDRLEELGMLLYDQSPIAIEGSNPAVGDPTNYDDFSGLGLDGAYVAADGLHIDADGNEKIANMLVEPDNLPAILNSVC